MSVTDLFPVIHDDAGVTDLFPITDDERRRVEEFRAHGRVLERVPIYPGSETLRWIERYGPRPKRHVIVCAECGSQFKSSRFPGGGRLAATTKFCSNACRQKAYRQRRAS